MIEDYLRNKVSVYETALIKVKALIPEGKGIKRDQKAFDEIMKVIDSALNSNCED